MKSEQIEKHMDRLAEIMQDFKGGPFIKIKVLGEFNKSLNVPFDISPQEIDLNEQLKSKKSDIPDWEWYEKSRMRVIKKGDIQTAWEKGSNTVIVLFREKLIIDLPLDEFCKEMGWQF